MKNQHSPNRARTYNSLLLQIDANPLPRHVFENASSTCKINDAGLGCTFTINEISPNVWRLFLCILVQAILKNYKYYFKVKKISCDVRS